MSTTEDQARAAMRAIAATVHDAPPLALNLAQEPERAPDEIGPDEIGPAWAGNGPHRPGAARSWLAPAAAAAVVVALAISLVVVKNLPNRSEAAPSPSASPAASSPLNSVNPSGNNALPEYYVAWTQTENPYLLVGDTLTGRTIDSVKAPAGVTSGAVYGAAGDDRAFIVTGERLSGVTTGTVWYLLRIAPGTKTPARLTPLPIPVSRQPAGVAFSPNGTEVAVAVPGRTAGLRVYSVLNGALLRQWSTTAPGGFAAEKAPAGSWQSTTSVLRWSPDGRQLAFAWDASSIRALIASGPGGNLMTRSRLIAAIGATYDPEASFTCDAAQGWQFITVAQGSAAGQGTVCAGSAQLDLLRPCTSPTDTSCKFTPQNSIGFIRATENSQGDSFMGIEAGDDCSSLDKPGNGAYLGWANIDGSEVIGSQVCAGHSRFGIFRGNTSFTPLPALPAPLPVAPAVMAGTVAW